MYIHGIVCDYVTMFVNSVANSQSHKLYIFSLNVFLKLFISRGTGAKCRGGGGGGGGVPKILYCCDYKMIIIIAHSLYTSSRL